MLAGWWGAGNRRYLSGAIGRLVSVTELRKSLLPFLVYMGYNISMLGW